MKKEHWLFKVNNIWDILKWNGELTKQNKRRTLHFCKYTKIIHMYKFNP